MFIPNARICEHFLHFTVDSAVDALGLLNTPAEIKKSLEELCIISMPKVIVTIEAGVGTKTLPMLIFEASFKGLAHNWSSQVNNIIVRSRFNCVAF